MMKKIILPAILLILLSACGGNKNASNGGAAGYGANGAAGSGNIRAGSSQDFVRNVGDRAFFALNSSTVNAKGRNTLSQQAQWLKLYPSVNVVIEGHSDERGTREYNIALGARRAQSVKTILIQNGISSNRIKTVSYGKERPLQLGETENAWSLNRRAVTVPKL